MLDKNLQVLKNLGYGYAEQAKYLLIDKYLQEEINSPSLQDLDVDLNPQIMIEYICKEISVKVSEDFSCSVNDVMLYWLTQSAVNGKLLCKSNNNDK